MIADRLLIALATLRLTSREVSDLKRFLSDRPVPEVTRILHQLEDAIEDGHLRVRVEAPENISAVDMEVESRIRQIYQSDLKISASKFVALLLYTATAEGKSLPKFDSKKGIGQWISQCLKKIPPSDLLRLATIAGNKHHPDDRSWQLR